MLKKLLNVKDVDDTKFTLPFVGLVGEKKLANGEENVFTLLTLLKNDE